MTDPTPDSNAHASAAAQAVDASPPPPITPFQFGDRREPLFGILHSAAAPVRQTAILICAPWGMEYQRAYRALRLLAMQLAATGFTVLRFDYRGTGDSSGDGDHLTLVDWIADTGRAAVTLREASESSQLAILGLRFGALMAQQAVADGLGADALVLWDGPPSGEVYVDNLRHLEQTVSDTANRFRPPRAQIPPAADDELLGHAWPPALAEQITALPGLRNDLAMPRHVFVSRDRTPAEGVDSLRLPDAGHWSDCDRLTTPWLPAASCKLIADTLAAVLP